MFIPTVPTLSVDNGGGNDPIMHFSGLKGKPCHSVPVMVHAAEELENLLLLLKAYFSRLTQNCSVSLCDSEELSHASSIRTLVSMGRQFSRNKRSRKPG